MAQGVQARPEGPRCRPAEATRPDGGPGDPKPDPGDLRRLPARHGDPGAAIQQVPLDRIWLGRPT